MKRSKGLIQIYTGDGKGKTTATLGLACRSRGHSKKVCFVSFHKDAKRWLYGEYSMLRKLGVRVIHCVEKHPHFHKNAKADEIRKDVLSALALVRKLFGGSWDLIILDEILISLRDGYLTERELLDLMTEKPAPVELVLTGRGATRKIRNAADLVSEVKKVKHPYDQGITSRAGIEY